MNKPDTEKENLSPLASIDLLDGRQIDQIPQQNTDREIWRETPDDAYAPSLHVTQTGQIGINIGGTVIVLDVQTWHWLGKYYSQVMPELPRR